ncbi:MAG TPA: CHRD domain-containing protein [Prolixibacteraceae bacterium]|nr:CHRD domain-containing protein [Prolixibacteraceae bacterium]
MKTKQIIPLLFLLAIVGFVSCVDEVTTPKNTVTFTATLNGANEVPANESMATGTATYKYDKTTHKLSGTVTFSGMTATASHIHKGDTTVAGPVVIPLDVTPPVTSPITLEPTTLDSTQRADLMNGLYYVNIHSEAFPGGEIRGQLMKKSSSGDNGGY